MDEFDFSMIGLVIGFALGMGLFFLLDSSFSDPMAELDIDKDKLAKDYIVYYYPEYTNCSIEYDSDLNINRQIVPGVNIYCNTLDDRDGLKFVQSEELPIQIAFEDITLEQIFAAKINKYKY